MNDQVFTPDTYLKKPFVAAKRVNITDYEQEDELLKLIQEHCVKLGLPLVISKLDCQAGWNKNVFSMEYASQLYENSGTQIGYDDWLPTPTDTSPYFSDYSSSNELARSSTSSDDLSLLSPEISPSSPILSNLSQYPEIDDDDEIILIKKRHLSDESSSPPSANYNLRSTNRVDKLYNGDRTAWNSMVSSAFYPLSSAKTITTSSISRRKKAKLSKKTASFDPQHLTKQLHNSRISVIDKNVSPSVQSTIKRSTAHITRSKQQRTVEDVDLKLRTNPFSVAYDQYKRMKNSDNGNDQPVSTKNDIDVSNTYAKDLDCPQEYAKQLQHILPRSLLPLGNDDLIRNLPPSLRAINLMCYFGGDGTGTPLHQDISGAIGHNIMLFGEESAYAQWLVTSKDDTNHLRQACRSAWKGREKCSFVESEQTCISLDVLAKRNVKTHVILQQPGDLVIIPSLCFHQVTNIGLSFKVAWNRITPHSLLNSFKIQLPLYRFIGRPELYRCKATIYFALKQIAVDIPKLSSTMQQQQSFLEKCRILLHLFANDVILPELIEPFPFDDDAEDAILQDKQLKARDIGFNRTCDFCCGDIFHRYYSCTDCQLDLCLSCYVSGRSCAHPNAFRMHEPYSHGIDNTDPFHLRNGSMMQYIQLYYDILDKLHMAFGSCSIIPEYSSFDIRGDQYSLATTCRRIEIYRRNNGFLSNYLYCGRCDTKFDMQSICYTYQWEIKTIFCRRPCYLCMNNSLNSSIYTCPSCPSTCLGCGFSRPPPPDTFLDLVYFDDINRTLWGGFLDGDLFQSMCWPDYYISLKSNMGQYLSDVADSKSIQYQFPEDFRRLAASKLIQRISEKGWQLWGTNNDQISMVNIIQEMSQAWTDYYRNKADTSTFILETGKLYSYTLPQDYKDYFTTMDIKLKIPGIQLLPRKKGRPRGWIKA